MNRNFLIILILFCMLPLANTASAQIGGNSLGCPSNFLFQDGAYWVYEKSNCVGVTGSEACIPIPVIPPGVLVYGAQCANTDPACKKVGMQCDCNSNCTPVGSGGSGPLAYESNGKNVTTNKGPRLTEFKEFVYQVSPGEWYKFNSGKITHANGDVVEFNACFKINTAPKKSQDVASGFTPDEWFIEAEISDARAYGSPKKVKVFFKDRTLKTYVVIYPPPSTIPPAPKKATAEKTKTPVPVEATPKPDVSKQ